MRNLGLGWRMLLLVLLGTGSLMGTFAAYSFWTSRSLIEEEIQGKALYLAQAAANRIETVEYSVEKVAEGLARAFGDSGPPSGESLYRLLERLVDENPEVSGSAVAFAPGTPGQDAPRFAPYVYRKDGELLRKDLGQDGYHYDSWDWYTLPMERLMPVWTSPYFDEGGGDFLMVTYAVPFFGRDGAFAGVVTCDVSLEWLTDYLASLSIPEMGYAMLLAKDGTYLSHPRHELIMRDGLLRRIEGRDGDGLRRLGERMERGESGIVRFESMLDGKPSWLAYAPIPSPEWVLGVVFPQEEALADVVRFTRQGLVSAGFGFGLLLVVVAAIARSVTRPLRQLDQAVRALGLSLDSTAGEVTPPQQLLAEGEIPAFQGGDEVARLSASFVRMRQDLKAYLQALQAETAARERIESDLRVAQEIQLSLIPKGLPACEAFEVRGLLESAREVGGDFYDFFWADPEHLCLAIGDVSGKGVPAALFMAVSRTILRAYFRKGDPADTLMHLNDELAAENEAHMFVSLFCAVIHVPSGECCYANGGHQPPVLVRRGKAEFLPKVRGALVGVMPGISFTEGRFTLEEGDRLFLYTDGVTEAMDASSALYGEARMLATLSSLGEADCAGILAGMRSALRAFVGNAEQSDDITMLVFRYGGVAESHEGGPRGRGGEIVSP